MISQCVSIQEVCRRLNLEQISNIFNTIYLVDSDGNTYSSSNVIKNEKDKEFVSPLLFDQDKIVMRYDNMDILETLTESLVYGVQGEPFEEEDYCQAIEAVQTAAKGYDPSVIGYRWDRENPRIQL